MANSPLGNASRQGVTQNVAATGTSTGATNAFGAQTYQIRVVANTACHYAIGDLTTPTATTASPFLPANWYEYVGVTPGQRIAVIRAATDGLVTTTTGSIWVTEMIV